MSEVLLINPIKDAMVTLLEAQRETLGIRTVKKDLSLDNLAEDIPQLTPLMPAVIVVYYGRTARRSGTILEMTLTYALIVATRSVQAPNISEALATTILDRTLELFQGKAVYPATQRVGFDLVSEELRHKDKVLTIYQQLFNTEVAIDFRSALKPS